MGEEVAIVVGGRDAEVLGLAGERLVGERDIAKGRWVPETTGRRRRKREHVRRLVEATPTQVERPQGRVIGKARLTSPPSLGPPLSAAAAIVSRAIVRARGNRRQRGEGTLISSETFIWPRLAVPLRPRAHRPRRSRAEIVADDVDMGEANVTDARERLEKPNRVAQP